MVKNPQARMSLGGPNIIPLSTNEYPLDETLAYDSKLLVNIKNMISKSQNSTADVLKENYEQQTANHGSDKLRSTIFIKSKERSIRATNDCPADILVNNPKLRASSEQIFGSGDNPKEQHNEINVTQSTDPSLHYGPELRTITDKDLKPTLKLKKAQESDENSTDRSDKNDTSNQYEPSIDESEPLNAMIFKNFGPEIRTPMLVNEVDKENSENDNELTSNENNDGKFILCYILGNP